MKGFLIFCLLLAVVTALPLKDKPKKYSARKQNRQDAAAPPGTPKTTTLVAEVSPDTNESQSSLTTPDPAEAAVAADIVSTKPVVGNNPFAESTKVTPLPVTETVTTPITTPAPQAVPGVAGQLGETPVVVQPEVPVPAAAAVPAVQPAVTPVVATPAPQPAAPLAPGTEFVTPNPSVVETTSKKPESEEDDSSSEEEEEEAEAVSRQLDVSSSSEEVPISKQVVVNAYVTPTGQVLVPLSVYQKYFQNLPSPSALGQTGRPVPQGFYSRQENEQGASSSEEEESDASGENSEEAPPVRVSPTSVIYPSKKPVNETENASVDEEEDEAEEKPSTSTTSVEETEDKSTSVESEETPVVAPTPTAEAVQVPAEVVPVQPVNSFPPPLASIPATRPTGEDDEAEAGRYAFPYYDDFLQEAEGLYDNDFYNGNNYYYRSESLSGYEY